MVSASVTPESELLLLQQLRAGDEAAFTALIERHQTALVRVAQLYVHSYAAAEEVVQETWIAVLRGLDRFEGRSTLKTWLFAIAVNRAKTRGQRDERTIPFSALESASDDAPAVDPDRFYPPGHEDEGWWSIHPTDWNSVPEERFLSGEVQALVRETIATLPPNQRAVITLRDLEGWESDEVCTLLNLTAGNQRVLLHRARARVQQALEAYLNDGDEAS